MGYVSSGVLVGLRYYCMSPTLLRSMMVWKFKFLKLLHFFSIALLISKQLMAVK